MPTKVVIIKQRLFDSLNNGVNFDINDDPITGSFANNFKGNVLEKFRYEFTIHVGSYFFLDRGWSFQALGADPNNPAPGDAGRIEMIGADFSESIKVGDTIKLKDRGTTNDSSNGGEAIVDAIEPGVLYVTFTTSSGNYPNTNNNTGLLYNNDWIANTTPVAGLEFKFALIENSEPTTFISKITGEEMTYKFNVPTVIGQQPVPGVLSGINLAGDSGTITCEFIGPVADNNLSEVEDTWKEYKIVHEFVGFPFVLDGDEDSLEGGNSPEDNFAGDSSLKYVAKYAFMRTLTDVNTKREGKFDSSDGSFGWLNESFDGGKSPYSITSLAYFNEDTGKSVDQLDIGSRVRVNCRVLDSSNSFVAADAIQITHTAILDSTQYTFSKTKTYEELHSLRTLRNTIDASASTGVLIQDFTASLVSVGIVDVQFYIDMPPADIALLVEGQGYQLMVNCQKGNNTNTGNRVQVGIDFNQYTKNSDIDGLWTLRRLEHFDHPRLWENSGSSSSATNAKLDIEEGVMTFCEFSLNLAENAKLNKLSLQIVTYNTVTEQFGILENIDLPLGNQVLSNGVQQISLDETRGFKLKEGNQFNLLQLRTTGRIADEQYYEMNVGWRVPWQEWLEYFNADPVFFDATKPLNGLNRFAATYSKENNPLLPNGDPNDYVIRVLVVADVEKESIVTEYEGNSENMEVYDYDKDDQGLPATYECSVTTHNKQGLEIAGSDGSVVFNSDHTEVRVTMTPLIKPVFSKTIDFTEVAAFWNRYAHGNLLTVGFQRLGAWLREQAADSSDTFEDGVNTFDKDDALYSSTTNSILALQNCNALYGCFSLDKYESYTATGKMFSTTADDDGLLFHICFFVDELGEEHTLSFAATTGGIGLKLNEGAGFFPAFVLGDSTTSTFQFNTAAEPIAEKSAKVALVYNLGKRDCKQLAVFDTVEADFDWSDVSDLDFKITRNADQITAELVSWTINANLFSTVINFNLNDDPLTQKFLGFNNIGFGFMSQDAGGFKDVIIEVATEDFWGVVRMTPQDSLNQEETITISTEYEQDESNELIQLDGDFVLASLDWADPSFVLRAKVNPGTFDAGNKYNITGEIGRKDNIS